jgi:serine/threonine-protein kinase
MSTPSFHADRNLLFGILAVQNDLVTRDQLVEAMNAWVPARERPLGDILRERGALGQEEHVLLEALVARQLARHQGDAEKSLAALSGFSSLKPVLDQILDDDVTRPEERPEQGRRAEGQPSTTRYQILRPHAKGGLGEVFVAQDSELHREVALKEIQVCHADDERSRMRFVLEAEITGGLEHPGIVPIYGLGTYGDGRPFYAMRFIRGSSLKEAIERFHRNANADYTDSRREAVCDNPRNLRLSFDSLEFRQLLRRFTDVCNAVAYAHSRGVLHRDLKPGNVMLGKFGETLVVDWGLAKAVGGRQQAVGNNRQAAPAGASDETPLIPHSGSGVAETVAGSAVGTPAFMSPEQAAGRIDQLGPATDVYSLGATLYYLLANRPPVAGKGIAQILGKVQAGDVDWNVTVPPALLAITRKAMSLRPADRYASALALAADIEHWLADEPVSVYAEPLPIRARRWMRKHPGTVSGIAAGLMVAIAGLAVGLLAVDHERQATANERDEKGRALIAETKAREDEVKARAAEQQARDHAIAALGDMTDDVIENQLARAPQLTKESKEFLRRIIKHYEGFAALTADDAESRAFRAEGHLRVAIVRDRLGEEKEAEAAYVEAIRWYEQLAREFPQRPEFRKDLGLAQSDLGVLLKHTGRLAQAETAFVESLAIRKQLVAECPTRPEYRRDVARSNQFLSALLGDTGRPKEAEATGAAALAERKELVAEYPERAEFRRDLAATLEAVGMQQHAKGQVKEAEQSFADAMTQWKKLVADDPSRADYRHQLAHVQNERGILLRDLGRLKDAEAAYTDAVAIHKELTEEFPTRPDYRFDLGKNLGNLARLLELTGRMKDAESAYGQAQLIQKQLAVDYPKRPEYRRDLAMTHLNTGSLLFRTGRPREGEAAMLEALAVKKRLAADFPTRPEFRRDLATTYTNLGAWNHTMGRIADAEKMFGSALEILKQLTTDFPARPEFHYDLARNHNNLGILLSRTGRLQDALAAYTEGTTIQRRLVASYPTRPEFQKGLALFLNNLGGLHMAAGRWKESEAIFVEALSVERPLVTQFPGVPEYRQDLARTLLNLGLLTAENRDFAASRRWLEESLPHHEAALLANPRHPEYRENYRGSVFALIQACAGVGDSAAALQMAEKRLKLGWDPASDAYDAACALARCVGIVEKDNQAPTESRDRQTRLYGDRAIAMLRDAVAAGYKDHVHMKKDTDLDSLRQRDDFKKLLAELEANAQKAEAKPESSKK